MKKTVYFLGAGFSADAGGPIQNQIIQFILDEDFTIKFIDREDILQAKEEFILFIKDTLQIDKKLWDSIALEDIFTPIDRSLSNGKSFKNFDVKELSNKREKFHLLMGAAIKYGVDYRKKNSEYIDNFAVYINKIAKERLIDQKDQIAIITTNWDIILDNSLNELVKEYSQQEEQKKSKKLAVVDYCCYISSLDKHDDLIKPGLLALGRDGYNIKYLKLHGSMNWLHCPSCQRMYVKFGEKTMLSPPPPCNHCFTNMKIPKTDNAIKLKSNLLLPTFLKDLSNIQIQLVWQNAGIELSEASKVVFIGYSLPQADFEIRQLLSRCIPNHAEVEVLCYPKDSNGNEKSEFDKAKDIKWYKTFFGKRIKSDDNIIFKTVPDYVSSL
ncbi:hypothetical protein ACFOWU_09510 [Epilithonimonas zeae]|uniref:Deacetylase sirtuin-type domain-containing protein n=1 Tax=Epilithonimonas zeae TaxID=1416779 RepID=A0A1N6GQA2_9FLAO|nr:hypothetical protein [Epilithonimonas zeae]SIO09709.1 hypothetical protein SAMN05444409_1984 [Epilithonimonas zeae]